MADLKQVRYQHPDLTYTDDLRTYADASLNLTDALPPGAKRRLVDALGRVVSEVDEATGDVIRTRHSDGADGPAHALVHETASPAIDDVIGRFAFRSRNDAGALYTGVELRAIVKDAAAGSEEVWFEAGLMNGGSFVPAGLSLRIVAGAVKLFIDGVEVGTGGGGGTSFNGARVTSASNQTIAPSTGTNLTFEIERWDVGGFHDNSTNNSRLTAPTSGYYHIGASIEWQANIGGTRHLLIWVNQTDVIVNDEGPGNKERMNVSTDWFLNAGDYVEVRVVQDSSILLDVEAGGAFSPDFWIHLIGE